MKNFNEVDRVDRYTVLLLVRQNCASSCREPSCFKSEDSLGGLKKRLTIPVLSFLDSQRIYPTNMTLFNRSFETYGPQVVPLCNR